MPGFLDGIRRCCRRPRPCPCRGRADRRRPWRDRRVERRGLRPCPLRARRAPLRWAQFLRARSDLDPMDRSTRSAALVEPVEFGRRVLLGRLGVGFLEVAQPRLVIHLEAAHLLDARAILDHVDHVLVADARRRHAKCRRAGRDCRPVRPFPRVCCKRRRKRVSGGLFQVGQLRAWSPNCSFAIRIFSFLPLLEGVLVRLGVGGHAEPNGALANEPCWPK